MSPYDGSLSPLLGRKSLPIERNENTRIDIDFSRKAPEGKFRVVSVDTFDGTDGVDGDFDTLALAKAHVVTTSKGQEMLKFHIYNDKGEHVGEGGSF